MDWVLFKNSFHRTWHSYVRPFIESKHCAEIYSFLKNQKGKEIAPKSSLTYRTFESSLDDVKVVVLIKEPFCEKYNDIQYADGIPLSCDYVEKIHSQLDEFYNAMEREFYGLNLNIIKENDVNFLIKQGVLFLSSSLTVEINSPGKHKDLWVPFIGHLIKTVFCKKDIPIVFCGRELYNVYKSYLDPTLPEFVVEQSITDCNIGRTWKTDGVFLAVNKYIWLEKEVDDIMWVNQNAPF